MFAVDCAARAWACDAGMVGASQSFESLTEKELKKINKRTRIAILWLEWIDYASLSLDGGIGNVA